MSQSTASIVRWREVLELFERVMDAPEEQRTELLRTIATEQPTLYPQLMSMLAADRSAESASFIDSPLQLADHLGEEASPQESMVGQQVGPYRILEHIGSGGMGQVWLAERADGRYAGQVAIKLLRSFGDPHIARRFEREGQLLARLQHPNIARLLDAGALANGQLYLVLEYVDGQRIDRYFDEKKLTIAERVRAFLPVCDAVAHAHTQLVVHRDLKPSNILVTRDGTVKLLDFGIAKLLAESNDENATELTQLVGRAFTPDFAAPEQIRGDDVSTQTDVYALGAILFRLLAGIAPQDKVSRATSRARDSMAFADEITPMSVALASRSRENLTHMLTEVADNRNCSVERLQISLKGDLDRVVGKALRLETEERYRSVIELRDDLERFIRHEPVSVSADSLPYRAKKFVSRHKVGVAATATITVTIIAGVIGTLWQANIARERSVIAERNAQRALQFERAARAEAERAARGEAAALEQATRAEAAQIEAQQSANLAHINQERALEQTARAEAFRRRTEVEAANARTQAELAMRESGKALSVKDFLVELFKTGDVNVADAEARELRSATTRLLNRGTERLKTQLMDQPEVRAELIDTVASLHLSIESPDQAEILYREQLAMLTRDNTSDSGAIAEIWTKIGRALRNQRKYKDAEEAQLKALAIMDRMGDKVSEARGRALLELVQMSFWTNTAVSQRSVNVARANESIAILKLQPQPSSLGDAWYGLGRLHEAAGENIAAAAAYAEGIGATAASVGGERHSAVAGGRQMRARVLGFAGQFEEAKRELTAAQQVFEDTVGTEHRFSVDVRAELAEVAHQLGESERALALFRQALVEQSRLRGENHNSTDRTRRLFAEALFDVERANDALALANEALQLTRKNPTSSKVFQARLLSLIGRAQTHLGMLESARQSLDEADLIWRDVKENFGSGVTALDLAQLNIRAGERARASNEVARALTLLASMRGKTRNEYWRARLLEVALLPAENQSVAAARIHADFSNEPEHRFFPRMHAQILETLASARLSEGQRSGACTALGIALEIRTKMDGASSSGARRVTAERSRQCLEFASRSPKE